MKKPAKPKSATTRKPVASTPLPSEILRKQTDADIFKKKSQPGSSRLFGQARALDAIDLGTAIGGPGFNIFAMGPEGTGRHTAIRSLLEQRVANEPAPDDWVYVSNFSTPHRPRAIRLPHGQAVKFRDAMDEMLNDLGAAIPAVFDSEEYKARASAINREIEEANETLFKDLNDKARQLSIAVMRTPMGFAFIPQKDGETVKPEQFEKLDQDEQARIQEDINSLQSDLRSILENIPGLEKNRREKLRKLNEEMASRTVTAEISEVESALGSTDGIGEFLASVAEDVIKNVAVFMEAEEAAQNAPLPLGDLEPGRDPRLRRYGVNVMVGNNTGKESCAPIVIETNPTYQNLIGHIEHISQMGALVTDFTLIKPGALHQANGGYLVIDARQLLMQAGAWEALKRVLRDGEIKVTSLAEQFSLVSTVSLDPDPIPLSVKVILVGDRSIYYLLHALDPDFASLFKILADFNDHIERSEETAKSFASMVRLIGERENIREISPNGMARTVDEAARLADDQTKLSLRIETITDILREADHCAGRNSHKAIEAEDIAEAVAQRRHRASRIRERMHESIARDIVLIDTDGGAIGQVNGLSVLSLADQPFGTATRITARVRMGSGKLVDIEREVKLGGPIHSKGVLILAGFLSARYALDVPMSLWASLVFEQSYGGVEGDSASSAELYAILSALSEVPIDQSYAVTGSVNQMGEVQAIGGVNEKIEGFFDICNERGLTGSQGVLIPASNVEHLMLREDIVKSCADGKFSVRAVTTIDQGLEILMGRAAGERNKVGKFPEGSINRLVEERLRAFADLRHRFGKENGEGNDARDEAAK